MTHEDLETQLHEIAVTKDTEALEEFFASDSRTIFAVVAEEDDDHDLERSVAQAELALKEGPRAKNPDVHVFTFCLDERGRNDSLWAVCLATYDEITQELDGVPDK